MVGWFCMVEPAPELEPEELGTDEPEPEFCMVEPEEPVEPEDPVAPIEPVEPVEPGEPVVPVEPALGMVEPGVVVVALGV